jgi:hypothetical protein
MGVVKATNRANLSTRAAFVIVCEQPVQARVCLDGFADPQALH